MLFGKITSFCSHLINSFLPATCVFCSGPAAYSQLACIPCRKDLPILTHHCVQCAQVLLHTTTKVCGKCLRQPPPFEKTHVLFAYQAPIVRLITAFKFEQQLAEGAFISACFIEKIQQEWYPNLPLPDLIIPVPLHPNRLCERGFNQALELAKPISKTLSIPIDYHSVTRIKATPPQSGLSSKQRETNLENAFAALKRFDGQFVVIIDDVLTTGYTATNLALLLKNNGAERIHLWTAARTTTG